MEYKFQILMEENEKLKQNLDYVTGLNKKLKMQDVD